MLDKINNLATTRRRGTGFPHKKPEVSTLEDIVHCLTRNLIAIVTPVALCVLVMAVYLVLTKTVYRADARVLIDANIPQVFREQSGEGRALDCAQVESQMAILRSGQVALAVIKRISLLPDIRATNGEADEDVVGGASSYKRRGHA